MAKYFNSNGQMFIARILASEEGLMLFRRQDTPHRERWWIGMSANEMHKLCPANRSCARALAADARGILVEVDTRGAPVAGGVTAFALSDEARAVALQVPGAQ